MKKIIGIAVLCLILGFAPSLTSATIDVNGAWTMTVQSKKGARSFDVIFAQDGEKLSVTMKTKRGDVKAAGTIIGNQVKWIMSRKTPRGPILMTYTGPVTEATINGTLTIRNRPPRTWTAKKK